MEPSVFVSNGTHTGVYPSPARACVGVFIAVLGWYPLRRILLTVKIAVAMPAFLRGGLHVSWRCLHGYNPGRIFGGGLDFAMGQVHLHGGLGRFWAMPGGRASRERQKGKAGQNKFSHGSISESEIRDADHTANDRHRLCGIVPLQSVSVVKQINGPLVKFFEGPSAECCSTVSIYHSYSSPLSSTSCTGCQTR